VRLLDVGLMFLLVDHLKSHFTGKDYYQNRGEGFFFEKQLKIGMVMNFQTSQFGVIFLKAY
jgi:hypothetical protein